MKTIVFSIIMLSMVLAGFSQEDTSIIRDALAEKIANLEGKVTGLEESHLETKTAVDKLVKIKFSGYIQANYRQVLDTVGAMDNAGKYLFPVGNFAGGAFGDGTQSQFHVRRGRMKLTYEQPLTSGVFQLDITQSGVGIKDAYLALKEPWMKSLGLKMGVFDRPFGFEISYSSGNRESPERTRLFQTLFPGERDVGAQLYFAPPEKHGWLSYFNAKGGLFNGNATAVDNDNNKDFIGRFGFSFPFADINLSIDGGVSAYMGAATCNDTTSGAVDARGFSYVIADKKFKKSDSADAQLGKEFERKYTGVDLQLYYDLPVIGGFSLRGEYLVGVQPGTSSSSSYYNAARNSAAPLYIRNFSGYYFAYVQNLFLKNQLVVKYDVYDPNTDVEGADLKLNSAMSGVDGGLSLSDLAFNTLGLGLIHHWDKNLKFVLYYDRVSNEKGDASLAQAVSGGKPVPAVAGLANDINDDVLTFRIQYKF